MYGIAQGRTRQWLHELAKENGVHYSNFTPPGAETTVQVRERAIKFFRKLCQELLIKFGTSTLNISLSHSNSIENLLLKYSISTENLHNELTKSYHSSIDSALDLLSLSSDQQSTTTSSSSSILSRNNSFEKQRNFFIKNLFHSPYDNHFSDLDILVISHGAVIRELIKYFACDLQTDIGEHFDTIQELAPNTSITRFQVTYSILKTKLQLIDYHNKIHLVNNEYNLDVINKCSS
jgi:broad specificity phosphatase PhoE